MCCSPVCSKVTPWCELFFNNSTPNALFLLYLSNFCLLKMLLRIHEKTCLFLLLFFFYFYLTSFIMPFFAEKLVSTLWFTREFSLEISKNALTCNTKSSCRFNLLFLALNFFHESIHEILLVPCCPVGFMLDIYITVW